MPQRETKSVRLHKADKLWINWKVRPAVPDDAPTIVKLAQEVKDFILPYALSEVSIRNYIYRWVVVYNPKTKEIGGAEHSIPNMDLRPADLDFLKHVCQMADGEITEFYNAPKKVLKAQPICPGKGTLRALIDWQKETYDEVWIWLSLKSTIREFCIDNGITFDGPTYKFLNIWKADVSEFSVGKWEKFAKVGPALTGRYQRIEEEAVTQVRKLLPKLSNLVPGDIIIIKGPMGSGKTLVAQTIDKILSESTGLKFRICDDFRIPVGVRTTKEVDLWIQEYLVALLKEKEEVGILVYQSQGRSDTLIKRRARGIISPTVTLDPPTLDLSFWWAPSPKVDRKPWYKIPLEDNSVDPGDRLDIFSEEMKKKWFKGANKYGPVFDTDPIAEAMEECVDLALYAKVVYFRLEQLKKRSLEDLGG